MLQFQKGSLDLLNDYFQVITLTDPDADTPEILHEIDITFAPLGYYCGREKMDACPKLKAIASNTTGDPHIDVDYAVSKEICVITLKDEIEFLCTITATAEHTWGLLLSLIRRMPWAFDSVKKGDWDRRLFPGQAMLSSLSLGIIGMGRLGSMVARYGLCFGMNVQYYDPYVEVSNVPGVQRVLDLVELVSQNDIISLHAPHNQETDKMLDGEIFRNFKTGSYFVNTARAEILDFKAFLEALQTGILAGAAIDVFEGEFDKGFGGSERFRKHPLIKYAQSHDNLLITPHIGGSTYDAWEKTELYTIRKIIESIDKRYNKNLMK